jgi:hypothetical protein
MNFPLKKMLLLAIFFAYLVKCDNEIPTALSDKELDVLAFKLAKLLAGKNSDSLITTTQVAETTTPETTTVPVPVTEKVPTIIPSKDGFILVFNQLSASQNITVTLPCQKLFGKNYNQTIHNKYILDSCEEKDDHYVEYVPYGPFKKIYSDC